MKTTIYLWSLIHFVCACSQHKSTADGQPAAAVRALSDDTSYPTGPTEVLLRLDSIDQVHNASVLASGDNITKAFVLLSEGDSTIHLTANIRQDHRIFGYAKPDIRSARLILFSVFTNDVENNPFGYKLGAYYDTDGMDGFTLKYVSVNGDFVQATVMDKAQTSTTVYFERKWIDLE